MIGGVSFDAEHHVYLRLGERWPSATDTLCAEGVIDKTWFTEEARWRGRIVHEGVRLINKGIALGHEVIDWTTVEPDIAPYLHSYLAFLDGTDFVIEGYEEAVCGEAYGYCGMPDLWGTLNGAPVVIDLKTGEVAAWTGFQTALYALALPKTKIPRKRFGLKLRKDGKPSKLVPFPDVNEERLALNMVAMFHWKLRTGRKLWDQLAAG